MQIVVDGSRSTDQDWLRAQTVPEETLPVLSEEQRRIAKSYGLADKTYARTVYAAELTRPELEEKGLRLGKLVESLMARAKVSHPEVLTVALRTLQGRFEIVARANEQEFTFRVREDLVDDLMEAGSAQALESLQRIVEIALLPLSDQTLAS